MGLFDQEEKPSVSQIKREKQGKTFKGVFLIKDISLRQGQGGPYLSFVIMDKTGAISASFFGGKIADRAINREDITGELLQEGVYEISLRKQKERNNVVVDSLRKMEENPNDYYIVPRAVYPESEDLRTSLDRMGEKHIKTQEGRKLYHLFWDRYGDRFLRARGSVRKHHQEEGGLALHTYMVLKIALFLGDLYSLDKEVIFLAGLLHDIGKIDEIGDEGFTREGDLLGHTVLSLLEVRRLCEEAGYTGKREANLLHCIASHHGQLEFGAPVSPKTLEAFVLHIADLADSKIYQFFKAISEIGEGEENSRYFKDLDRRIYLLDGE